MQQELIIIGNLYFYTYFDANGDLNIIEDEHYYNLTDAMENKSTSEDIHKITFAGIVCYQPQYHSLLEMSN